MLRSSQPNFNRHYLFHQQPACTQLKHTETEMNHFEEGSSNFLSSFCTVSIFLTEKKFSTKLPKHEFRYHDDVQTIVYVLFLYLYHMPKNSCSAISKCIYRQLPCKDSSRKSPWIFCTFKAEREWNFRQKRWVCRIWCIFSLWNARMAKQIIKCLLLNWIMSEFFVTVFCLFCK